jgi:hypothetical protein
MAQHQISASQIRPGANIIIRGQIEYIRVRSLMGPEDIDKLNQARTKSRYKLDRNKPLTRLSLYNTEVIPQSPDGKLTIEEYYVYERMFQTQDKPELGNRWNIDNKGNRLPALLKVLDGQARQIMDNEIPPSTMSIPTEPAKDQIVTVILNVYPSDGGNNGIGIQAIIFNDEPQWFSGGNSVNTGALAALGITLSGPIVNQTGTIAVETPAQQAEVAAPAAPAAPVAPVAAAPVQAPVTTPVQQVAVPVVQQAAPQNTVVDATSGLAMPAPVTQAVAPVAAPAAPNPQAAQLLNAVAQQQAPVQADPASAFGVTPEAQPQPVAPEASVDSPWAI